METPSLFQGHPQNNDQILTFEIVFHYRRNSFYTLVHLFKQTRDRENKEKTKKQTQKL